MYLTSCKLEIYQHGYDCAYLIHYPFFLALLYRRISGSNFAGLDRKAFFISSCSFVLLIDSVRPLNTRTAESYAGEDEIEG